MGLHPHDQVLARALYLAASRAHLWVGVVGVVVGVGWGVGEGLLTHPHPLLAWPVQTRRPHASAPCSSWQRRAPKRRPWQGGGHARGASWDQGARGEYPIMCAFVNVENAQGGVRRVMEK